MLHQLRYPRIGAQQSSAGQNARSHARLEKLRRSRRAIGPVIVIAQNDDNVRDLRRFVHDPEISGVTQDRVTREIQNRDKRDHENQKQKLREDSAALTVASFQDTSLPVFLICPSIVPHLLGSVLRKLSAASSGSVPLK